MEEVLYGIVTKVTFFSDDTHFGVIRVKLDNEQYKKRYKSKLFTNILTVTGNFDRKPVIDEEYDFTGDFVNNEKFGIQFKARTYSRRNEFSKNGIISYLSSDLFPGIGTVTATKVYEILGKDTLSLIEADKNILDRVTGLNEKQKDIIYDSINLNESKRRAMVGLLDLGITMHTAAKIINVLKERSLDIIKENPFQLMDLVEGFGFRRSDRIAMDLGIKEDSDVRLEALTTFLIKDRSFQSGDSYLEYDTLYEYISNEVNINDLIFSRQKYDDVLKSLIIKKKIVLDQEKNVFNYFTYHAEILLAKTVNEIINNNFQLENNNSDIEKIFEKNELKEKIKYNDLQRKAILTAIKENFVIITGGPGTGKSTIIKAVINTIVEISPNEEIREKITLLAPTGRAAKRLKELTNFNSMTIHKFLGYEGHGVFKHGKDAKVDAKVLIVDEFSMVDIHLAARLFASLEANVKVILVGDVDQLPSVEPGNVLADLIESDMITTIKLNKIHRQASNSTIINLAHSINEGFIPETIVEKQSDRNFICLNNEDIISKIILTVEQAINSGMDLVKDIQVLVPIYKGELGIHAINYAMQEKFNPGNGYEIKHMSRFFRVNDKVIQLVNRSEKKVMNGDIGYVHSINTEDNEITGLTVMYDFGPVDYEKNDLDDLNHAYAISIHKSQGSEFDLVIMPFSFKYYVMLKRKLIYTGITRAKKFLIMIGDIKALLRGVSGIESKRKTKLVDRVKTDINIYDIEEFDEVPEMENLSPYDFM